MLHDDSRLTIFFPGESSEEPVTREKMPQAKSGRRVVLNTKHRNPPHFYFPLFFPFLRTDQARDARFSGALEDHDF